MFDFGLFEIVVVMIIGLIFIKPEDLPNAIRSVSKTFKNIKSYIFNAKDEFNKVIDEIEIQEFNNNILNNEKKYLEKLKREFEEEDFVIKNEKYIRYYYDK